MNSHLVLKRQMVLNQQHQLKCNCFRKDKGKSKNLSSVEILNTSSKLKSVNDKLMSKTKGKVLSSYGQNIHELHPALSGPNFCELHKPIIEDFVWLYKDNAILSGKCKSFQITLFSALADYLHLSEEKKKAVNDTGLYLKTETERVFPSFVPWTVIKVWLLKTYNRR